MQNLDLRNGLLIPHTEKESPFRFKCVTCLEADNEGKTDGYIIKLKDAA